MALYTTIGIHTLYIDRNTRLTSMVDRTQDAGFPWLVSDASARGERGQSAAPRME